MKIKISLLIALCCLLYSNCYAYNITTIENDKSFLLNTSSWQNVAIGNYILKLPNNAIINLKALTLGDSILKWEEKLNIKEANALLNEEYNKLKSDDRKNVELIKNFGANNKGSLLKYYDKVSYEGVAQISYKMYFVNKNKDAGEYVYFLNFTSAGGFEWALEHDDKEVLEFQKEQEQALFEIAKNIYSTVGNFTLNRKGIHFNNGFISVENIDLLDIFYNQNISMQVEFPEYHGIELVIIYNSLLGDIDNPINATIITEHAKEKLDIICKDICYYDFKLGADLKNGEGIEILLRNNVYYSYSNDGMKIEYVPDLKESSFKSTKEALSLWNAILETFSSK